MTFMQLSVAVATAAMWAIGLAGILWSAAYLADVAFRRVTGVAGVYWQFIQFVVARRRAKSSRPVADDIQVDYEP